jgi:hypothetical protein
MRRRLETLRPSPELALYLAAAVAYIALGVVWPNLLWSWVEGAAFLLLAVWILPSLVRRLR